ncbi:MAG: fimbria/pilus periplasmic chaperone [Rhodomicrobium sp.]|nr:fimbria/pilus periplasmic chaperone [Rhodomicrobium sp.]
MAVEPLLLDILTAGPKSQKSFKVVNNGAAPLPVEINVSRLEFGHNGEQKTEPSVNEFLIYPAQAMIPIGGTQVFRVQWIGDLQIDQSRSYRMMVSQLPVKLPKGQSGIQIVMSFGLTVNVAPPQAKGGIVVMGAAPVAKDGKRFASVTVKNPGNKHTYLRQASIRLSGGSWSADLTPGDIAQKVGLGIIQPGKERRFVLPVEVPASVSKIEAAIKITPEPR